MEQPLWTEAYAPSLSEIPQDRARKQLRGAVTDPVNLLVYGPPGVGKTAAVRAVAKQAHTNVDSDFIELNVADFFDRTKSEIKDDPRFKRFLSGQVSWTRGRETTKYKRNWSKRDMINHVLKESASYAPSTGTYKTVLLDNAESIREDFQQALRRVMEQFHRNTQFIIATRKPTKLIPPLRSRCVPVPMPAPSTETIADILEEVITKEEVAYDREGIEFIAGYADGNLREAMLAAQTTATTEGEVTMTAAYDAVDEIGIDGRVASMLDDAEAGDFSSARSELDDLLVDDGLSAGEILTAILDVGQSRYEGKRLARLYRLAGAVDLALTDGTSGRIQIGRLLAALGEDQLPDGSHSIRTASHSD